MFLTSKGANSLIVRLENMHIRTFFPETGFPASRGPFFSAVHDSGKKI